MPLRDDQDRLGLVSFIDPKSCSLLGPKVYTLFLDESFGLQLVVSYFRESQKEIENKSFLFQWKTSANRHLHINEKRNSVRFQIFLFLKADSIILFSQLDSVSMCVWVWAHVCVSVSVKGRAREEERKREKLILLNPTFERKGC